MFDFADRRPIALQRDSNALCLDESVDTYRITVWYDRSFAAALSMKVSSSDFNSGINSKPGARELSETMMPWDRSDKKENVVGIWA